MSSRSATGSRINGDVLFVGSLPYEDSESAFRDAAKEVGNYVACLPDGEPGERKYWIQYLIEFVFANHPDLVEVDTPKFSPEVQPTDEEGVRARGASEDFWWTYAIKEGVKDFRLDLGYADFALESYKAFERLVNEGVIGPDVRFQISIPATMSAVDGAFKDDSDRERVYAAYRDAIARNVRSILEVIPAEKLVFQFDLCNEIIDIAIGDETYYSYWPERTRAEKVDHRLGLLRELGEVIPPKVPVGLHWCYGTWGGWPMVGMEDLSLCVELSNRAVREAPRPIDYVHMPTGETAADKFFAPLADLDIGDTKVFLGMVHFHEEDPEALKARITTAHKYRDDFGIAAVCGYGREDPSTAGALFVTHRSCAEMLHA